jgi:hypothetical protein
VSGAQVKRNVRHNPLARPEYCGDSTEGDAVTTLVLVAAGALLLLAAFKAPMGRAFRVLLGVIAALILVAGVSTLLPGNSPTSDQPAASASAGSDTSDSSGAAAKAAAAANYTQAPLTVESVTAALISAGIKSDSVVVKGGAVTVSRDAGTVWDENDMVHRTGRDALDAFAILFTNPGLSEATYVSTTSFTDQYGKSSTEAAVKLTYSKATAQKIDWKGLGERALGEWQAPYSIATYYYIHPGVWKKLTDRIPVEGGTGL